MANLAPPEGLLIAAVSGGGDSMAMLELLALSRRSLNERVVVACVDHGLRSEAVIERGAVRALAHRAGFQFYALETTGNRTRSEDVLRRRRHEALKSLSRRLAASAVLTAHTRDDQIETIVFRFFRGSGREGLAGIRPINQQLVRPLLDFGREELRGFLRSRGAVWFEDASNSDLSRTRNLIRRRVLPFLRGEFGDGHVDHLAVTGRVWEAEAAYLEDQAARYVAFVRTQSGAVDLERLREVPEALLTRVLRSWLISLGHVGVPELKHLRGVMKLIALKGPTLRPSLAQPGSRRGVSMQMQQQPGVDLPGLRVYRQGRLLIGLLIGPRIGPLGGKKR